MRLWFLGCLLVLGVSVRADEPAASEAGEMAGPAELIERMAQAIREQSYRGVLVFGNSQQWHTLNIVHRMKDGVESEKVVHLTGIPRQISRIGERIAVTPPLQPGQTFSRAGILDNALDGSTSLPADFYHLASVMVKDRVAGRSVVQVQIIPSDEHRYGQQLWLDEETSLLLRSDIVDDRRRVIERYQFAAIDIGVSLADSEFELPPDSDVARMAAESRQTEASAAATSLAWFPAWLPDGFRESSRKVVEGAGVQMYSDGLASFSLFVEAIPRDPMPDMSNRWGATAAVVRHQTHAETNYRITVVGEIPVATARRIAWSVAPKES